MVGGNSIETGRGANEGETVFPSGERLGKTIVEVRFADLEKDILAVTTLLNQRSAIEHLAGIAPAETPKHIDVRKYGIKNPNFGIVIATEEEMKDYFRARIEGAKPSAFLLIAEDEGLEVVGTVTVEKPPSGLTWAGVSKFVVSEEARGKGIGRSLLRAANALIFSRLKDGGMELPGAAAGIIQGVRGSEVPQNLFRSEGYVVGGESTYNCVSWDNGTQLFKVRSAVRMTRGPQGNKIDTSYLPKKAS